MPCNFNQRELAARVKAGIRAAGGTPMEFNTIAVSDGVSMGTEGMKASLVSREVIADSIELVARGHLFDGLVCLVGCDKTLPGAAMALARLDLPGLALYNGTINPGVLRGRRDATVVTVFEAIGAYRAGKISLEELREIEDAACPGPGACGGQFTANTMSTALEFLGISPGGLNAIPATDPAKLDAAERAGRLVMELVNGGIRPSAIMTRAALDNAIASVAATGGSTNGVLHLLAIAHELGIPLGIEDFDRIAERTPIVANLMPGGRFTALDIHEAGGIGLVTRELLKRDLVDGSDPQRRRPDPRGGRRGDRRDAGPGGRRVDRSADQADRRPRDPAGIAGAGGVRHQARRPRDAVTSAVRRGSSTPRRRATTPCARSASDPATSSSFATRGRSAAPACRRCCRSPPRSSARASAATLP